MADKTPSTEDVILDAAYNIRGRILQRSIEIESLFDLYIAESITSDENKISELICLILAPRVSFEDKRQIFVYLVDMYNPELRKNYPDFAKDLQTICKERNVYAHYPIAFSNDATKCYEDKKVVTFVKLKNSKNQLVDKHEKSESDINDLLRLMGKYIDAIVKLGDGKQPPL